MKSEENTVFKTSQFMKFFLIHFFYFIGTPILGFIITFSFYGVKKGYILSKNMGFAPSLCAGFIVQTIFSMLSSSSIYFIYGVYLDDKTNFNIFDHALLFVSIALRAIVIAIKYGYFSPLHIEFVTSYDLPEELNSFDQVTKVIYVSDAEYCKIAIDKELDYLDIEPDHFQLCVFEDQPAIDKTLSKQEIQRLNDEEQLISYLKNKENIVQNHEHD